MRHLADLCPERGAGSFESHPCPQAGREGLGPKRTQARRLGALRPVPCGPRKSLDRRPDRTQDSVVAPRESPSSCATLHRSRGRCSVQTLCKARHVSPGVSRASRESCVYIRSGRDRALTSHCCCEGAAMSGERSTFILPQLHNIQCTPRLFSPGVGAARHRLAIPGGSSVQHRITEPRRLLRVASRRWRQDRRAPEPRYFDRIGRMARRAWLSSTRSPLHGRQDLARLRREDDPGHACSSALVFPTDPGRLTWFARDGRSGWTRSAHDQCSRGS